METSKQGAGIRKVRGKGDEVLVDEGGCRFIAISFGLQPNASPSSGRRAEIEK
jgi:hypothetical protein